MSKEAKSKYHGQAVDATCPVCGNPVYQNQARYDVQGKSLHVNCAERERDVYTIDAIDQTSCALVCGDISEAISEIKILIEEMEPSFEGYNITKCKMSNLKWFDLGEHTGF